MGKGALSFAFGGREPSTEAELKRLVTALALLSSLASLLVIAGGGLALLAIENSGERGMGALLAACSAIAFAAVMALLFAREGAFGGALWKGAAIAAAILGAIPPAGLAFLAIRFAGMPIGSRMPLVDWAVLGIGVLFALGAVSILALGHRRSQEAGGSSGDEADDEAPVVHMQQIRHAQTQLRTAFEAVDQRSMALDDESDIRVRRV